MTTTDELLNDASRRALAYAATIDQRRVMPDAAALAALAGFDEQLPQHGLGAVSTLALLDDVGGPATMATTGPLYFGFVNGATLPIALSAAWLADAWDQNAALPAMSPVAAKLYDVSSSWLVDLLGMPSGTGVAFVTGATVANASALAAARDALLAGLGWDVEADGLFGAPPIDVVIGERAHSTLRKSLGLVGLGRDRVTIVPADEQGRMRADLLPDLPGPVLVCAQAGEVNTGAFDPFDDIADWLAPRGGWMHVDAAFGLWAHGRPQPRPPRQRTEPRRLVGDRRAQVAERHVRLRHRLRQGSERSPAHVRCRCRLPAACLGFRGDASHAAVVAAGPADRGVGGAAHAGPRRRRRAGDERVRRGDVDRGTPPPARASRS